MHNNLFWMLTTDKDAIMYLHNFIHVSESFEEIWSLRGVSEDQWATVAIHGTSS